MSETKKRYYRKHVELIDLIDKIKLWPSRKGILHGIRTIAQKGKYIEISTHCGETFVIYNSKNSRCNRWIRNKWAKAPCKKCNIPNWKLEKYSSTHFTQSYGSDLSRNKKDDNVT